MLSGDIRLGGVQSLGGCLFKFSKTIQGIRGQPKFCFIYFIRITLKYLVEDNLLLKLKV